MKTIRLVAYSLIVIFGVCCLVAPRANQSPQGSNLTAGMVKTKIIKGVTTQAEILQYFGAPNIVTKNRSDDEVWNYSRMSFQSYTSVEGAIIFNWAGSRAVSTATTRSFDLIIIFDDKDVVKDYSVISAQF